MHFLKEKSILLIFILIFSNVIKCDKIKFNQKTEKDSKLESRLRRALQSIGALPKIEQRAGLIDGDINEMLDVVFSFIQAVVALSTTFSLQGGGDGLTSLSKQQKQQQQSQQNDQSNFDEESEAQLEMESELGTWSEWSECSKTCGSGTQFRMRGCEENDQESVDEASEGNQEQDQFPLVLGPIRSQLRRKSCEVKERPCNLQECDTSEWGQWSQCHQRRSRVCLDKIHSFGCDHQTRSCSQESQNQLMQQRQRFESWSSWQAWSSCSVTCGTNGRQYRIRYSRETRRSDRETRLCQPQPSPCYFYDRFSMFETIIRPPQQQWSQWEPWSTCSRSCDGGEQTRRRYCGSKFINRSISSNQNCPGSNIETRICNNQKCCCWSNWMWVSSCSVTCGNGIRRRSRMCLSTDGQDCIGPSQETIICNNRPC